MSERERLRKEVDQQARQLRKAEKSRDTWFASTVFLGTLGIVFILPVIIGAYLGNWLDKQLSGFSVGWTASLVIVGVFVGCMNVYLMIREDD
jgi:ATP synthase protein I